MTHEILNHGVVEMQQEEEKLMATTTTIFTVEHADSDDKKENGTVMVDSVNSSMEECGNLNVQVRRRKELLSCWLGCILSLSTVLSLPILVLVWLIN